jgi:hypothetical protein
VHCPDFFARLFYILYGRLAKTNKQTNVPGGYTLAVISSGHPFDFVNDSTKKCPRTMERLRSQLRKLALITDE